MNSKLWYPALILAAAFVGCAGEEGPPPHTELPQTPVSEIKPSPKADEAKTATPKEEMKAVPKEEMKAVPKEEMKKEEPPKVEGPKAETPKADAKASKLTDDEIAEIKKLPAAEQDIALKQVSCPVSGEHLGEMGIPVKTTAEGKTFFLCCKSCEKEVKADPKAVVAKLPK
jgi:hypothetical protein